MQEIADVLKAHIPQLIEIGVGIAATLLGLLKTKLGRAILEGIKMPLAQKLLSRLLDLVAIKVAAFEQTLIPAIKAAAADGKITPAEREALHNLFIEQVKAQFAAWDVLKFLLKWDEADITDFVAQAKEAQVLQVSTASAAKAANTLSNAASAASKAASEAYLASVGKQ